MDVRLPEALTFDIEIAVRLPTRKAADDIETDDDIKVEIVEVEAQVDDDDSPYSAKMCPQPLDLICERKRKRTTRQRLVPCFIHASPRPREHRSAPRGRGGDGRDDGGGDGGDDGGGGGGGGDDGGGGGDGPLASRSRSFVGRQP